MDKLDLLGVRNDYEMELKAKYELAKEISEEVKEKCTDTNVMSNEFYNKCIDEISKKLNENQFSDDGYSDEVYEIWDIIEKNYIR